MMKLCASSAALLVWSSLAAAVGRATEVDAVAGVAGGLVDEIDRLNGASETGAAHAALAGHGAPHAEFELIPSSSGLYIPGEVIDIDVWLHSLDDTERLLRLVIMDMADTDPAVALPIQFGFDFSSLTDGGDMYFQDDTLTGLPDLALVYVGLGPVDGTMLVLPAHGSLHVGTFMGVTLPAAPGTYRVDVLNADETDDNRGAELRSGFGVLEDDPLVRWRAENGEIIGEPLVLIVGAVECRTDAHCDDGLFCNGRERCTAALTCQPARRLPCAPQDCNENENYCRRVGDPSIYTRSAGDSGENTRSAK